MKVFSSAFVLFLMLMQAGLYIRDIRRGKTKPALSTWGIFLLGTGISMTTYVLSRRNEIISGVMIIADFFVVISILGSILLFGDRTVRLRSFEKWYVLGCVVAILYGITSGNAFGSNVFAQVLIGMGYFPTYQKLVTEKRNTESYHAWYVTLALGFIGLTPALLGRDVLALIYAVRTILLVAGVLFLMRIYDRRTQRS